MELQRPISPTADEAEAACAVCREYVRTATSEHDLWGFLASVDMLSDRLNYRLGTEFPSDLEPDIRFQEMCRHMPMLESFDLRSLPYADFLKTGYWAVIRDYVLYTRGRECAICKGSRRVNVHHRTYEHHGEEHQYLDDLILLCHPCHSKFHGKLPERPNGKSTG